MLSVQQLQENQDKVVVVEDNDSEEEETSLDDVEDLVHPLGGEEEGEEVEEIEIQ